MNIADAARRFRDAFTYDPGHSDLDDEQPISISVTLGDWRKLDLALSERKPILPVDELWIQYAHLADGGFGRVMWESDFQDFVRDHLTNAAPRVPFAQTGLGTSGSPPAVAARDEQFDKERKEPLVHAVERLLSGN